MEKWYVKDKGKTILCGDPIDVARHHPDAVEIPDSPGEDYIWKDVKWILNPDAYKKYRKEAYPLMGDQLDAIWMQLNYWRLNGQELIQDVDNMLGQILQVKEDYPKSV